MMSSFDRASTCGQRTWTSPKCDVFTDGSVPGETMEPVSQTHYRHGQIRCWAEGGKLHLYKGFYLDSFSHGAEKDVEQSRQVVWHFGGRRGDQF